MFFFVIFEKKSFFNKSFKIGIDLSKNDMKYEISTRAKIHILYLFTPPVSLQLQSSVPFH